jgi:hypothetical protein
MIPISKTSLDLLLMKITTIVEKLIKPLFTFDFKKISDIEISELG